MKNNFRTASILKATSLDFSVTGIAAFDLSDLDVSSNLEVAIPTNLRLGHVVEKIVAELIKNSNSYNLLYENIQIINDKKTIGEIDFIIENSKTHEIIHLEFAYKFYLFDPEVLSKPELNCWIGPNRNDSLYEKLEKLKTKQFPLLFHPCTQQTLPNLPIDRVAQQLCLLVSLYIPFDYKGIISNSYQKGVKGYYINFETFTKHHTSSKTYCLPSKKDWGIDPFENKNWSSFTDTKESVLQNMAEKQGTLCWQMDAGTATQFFIIWW
jgi:hypothetical protein